MLQEAGQSALRQQPNAVIKASGEIVATQLSIREPFGLLRRLIPLGSTFGRATMGDRFSDRINSEKIEVIPPSPETMVLQEAITPVVVSRRPVQPTIGHVVIPGRNETSVLRKPATSFREMLDTSKGNIFQRTGKWWIKPKGNPERTIKLYEALQVHRLQNLAIALYKSRTRKADEKRGYVRQTNYTMYDHSLASMVEMATSGTVFNEKIHIYHMLDPIPFFVVGALLGTTPLGATPIGELLGATFLGATPIGAALLGASFLGGLFLVGSSAFILFNLGLVLAQRYARAKLSLVIDKSIQKGRTFEVGKFPRRLALRLPEHVKRVEPLPRKARRIW